MSRGKVLCPIYTSGDDQLHVFTSS